MASARRCRGTNVDGSVCEQPTKDASGYCRHHKAEADSLETMGVLHCNECTHQLCPKRGIGANGLCYYEVYDTMDSVEDFERLRRSMREAIKYQRTLYRRLARSLATGHSEVIDTDGVYHDELPKRVQSLIDSLLKNYELYAKLCGWDKIAGPANHKEKLRAMGKMFDLEQEPPVGKAEKSPAEVLAISPMTSKEMTMSIEEIRSAKARATEYKELDLTEDVSDDEPYEKLDDEEEEEEGEEDEECDKEDKHEEV